MSEDNYQDSRPPLILRGYLLDIDPIKKSVMRENFYQRISIATPLFNDGNLFLYKFNFYDIIFFGEGKNICLENLKDDYSVGDYVKVQIRGNLKSSDEIIAAKSFNVGETICKSYLFQNIQKSVMFFKMNLKHLTNN